VFITVKLSNTRRGLIRVTSLCEKKKIVVIHYSLCLSETHNTDKRRLTKIKQLIRQLVCDLESIFEVCVIAVLIAGTQKI